MSARADPSAGGRVIPFLAVQRRLPQEERAPILADGASVRNLLTTAIIYSVVLPMILLDLWITVYQWICFPIYGISRVRRRAYFAVDRHRLPYLNPVEKANCTYCSYATGLFAYAGEVTARTEQYWCPIRHARRVRTPHTRYSRFAPFGDASSYRRRLPALRRTLRPRARPGGRQERRERRGSLSG